MPPLDPQAKIDRLRSLGQYGVTVFAGPADFERGSQTAAGSPPILLVTRKALHSWALRNAHRSRVCGFSLGNQTNHT